MDDDFDFPFELNYERIIDDPTMLSITRLMATKCVAVPYITPGEYIKKMSTDSLDQIMALSENPDNEHFGELILMSEMLVQGEGLVTESMEQLRQNISIFISFIAIESLHRKGLAKAVHNNFSFGDDMRDKPVAQKIE